MMKQSDQSDVRQLTREQAIEFGESGAWRKMTPEALALFQLQQDMLCMPFSEFHKAVETALGRPVFTHEFGLNRAGLMAELQGKAAAPTFGQVIDMLPAEKVVIVRTA